MCGHPQHFLMWAPDLRPCHCCPSLTWSYLWCSDWTRACASTEGSLLRPIAAAYVLPGCVCGHSRPQQRLRNGGAGHSQGMCNMMSRCTNIVMGGVVWHTHAGHPLCGAQGGVPGCRWTTTSPIDILKLLKLCGQDHPIQEGTPQAS